MCVCVRVFVRERDGVCECLLQSRLSPCLSIIVHLSFDHFVKFLFWFILFDWMIKTLKKTPKKSICDILVLLSRTLSLSLVFSKRICRSTRTCAEF